MTDLLIVSPCFYPDASPARLMCESARVNGLNVELYGVGLPFHAHGADAQVAKLRDWMAGGKKANLILVTDCRDVLFLADEKEIVGKFLAFRSGLVMSTERGCWPPDPAIVSHYYGKDPNGYDYINAGQYIGEWEYVMHCLDWLLKQYREKWDGLDNSQGWWMQARMRGELEFALDSRCQLFQSMSGGADAHVETHVGKALECNRIWNKVTNTHPCSIHFNGNPGNDAPQREMFTRLSGTGKGIRWEAGDDWAFKT